MEKKLLDEVHACFENERRVVAYFKDKYAVDGIQRFIGAGKKVSEVKSSPGATLLQRTFVRENMKTIGDNILTPDKLSLW